jgi:DNA (cytosine-5)-methyltransferase 1
VKYLSVCSGIEAATCGWHFLGWQPEAFSEIEKFPSKVLAHHYPNVPNLGDMTKFEEWNLEPIDLLVGGTPCQSFSVAGLRKGLSDPRGNLMLTFGAIANRFRPRWLVWENVPGVLSSNGGRDFGTFLGMLVELGYGWAYRVLDAQYFGVAQRRRRVFVVGYLGNWRCAAAVLFERHSLQGNPAPSREKGQEVAGTFKARANSGGWGHDVDLAASGYMRTVPEVALCLNAGGMRRQDVESETILPVYSMITANTNANGLGVSREIAPTLDRAQPAAVATTQFGCIAGSLTARYDSSPCADRGMNVVAQPIGFNARQDPCSSEDLIGAIDTDRGTQAVMQSMAIRRLTPVECERLQGFPDNYTNIPNAADGPRYKALGNSMAVPVMSWIGKRIQQVEDIVNQNKAA